MFDGIHVIRSGRYFGPPTPGPWRHAVEAVGLDPFEVGPVFVATSTCRLFSVGALLLTASPVGRWAALLTAVGTLWCLPVGTATSVVTIAVLVAARAQVTT